MDTAYNSRSRQMRYTSLAPSAQSAYADLFTSLFSSAIPDRGISYFTRTVKGRDYWYMQHVVGNRKRSRYIGPNTAEIRQLIDKCKHRQADNGQQRTDRKQLVAICSAAGLHSLTRAEARVHEVLVQSGLFEAGAVIVGAHAFLHIGNMLCVEWPQGRGPTEDIAQEQTIAVASPPVDTDVRETLLKAEKGVLALPAISCRPGLSVSYRACPSCRHRRPGALVVPAVPPALVRPVRCSPTGSVLTRGAPSSVTASRRCRRDV